MVLFSTSLPYDGTWSVLKGYLDDLIGHGFTQLRMDIPQYYETSDVENRSKPGVLIAIGKGVKVTWGLSGGQYGSSQLSLATWPDYRAAVLSAAQWAQDNGVYEFQIGNEEESHNQGTDLSDAQLIVNLKSLATEVKAIFTRGKVSYTCFHGSISAWIKAGKGDIDILASNVYMAYGAGNNPEDWEGEIDALVGAFGPDGTYITEFGPNSTSYAYWGDEAAQAAAVQTEIDYIKSKGITRTDFYRYNPSDAFGVRYSDGTYRQAVWDVLRQ
jgi:hypothetical protein